ncbi:hypothetical protein BDP27DRAFT_161545 [Rhodocollybia butyracea]|uniref:Uncharacterized protein n=1 Tax=Rhodocollybia butyracea TaxID=206335 RepID=A0A9P5PLY2_9AGAR|nr:hypothetical protein BDP27DRAFT_161545 [Rhodocollybia butyracea]
MEVKSRTRTHPRVTLQQLPLPSTTSPLLSSVHPADDPHPSPSTSSCRSYRIDTEEFYSPSSHISPAQPTQVPTPIPSDTHCHRLCNLNVYSCKRRLVGLPN